MQTLELFIVRDMADGAIIEILAERESAEAMAVAHLKSFSSPKPDEHIPTVPVLEVHEVEIGEPVETVPGKSLRRRVETRERRQQREYERVVGKLPPDEMLTTAQVIEMLGVSAATRAKLPVPTSNKFYSKRAIEMALRTAHE